MINSIIHTTKHHKIVQNFLTSLDRWNRKKRLPKWWKNKKKTNKKRWNLWRILDFKCLYFLEKYSMILQNSVIKSLIHKIKNIKNSWICWQVQIDEIENKMSNIIKNEKQIVNSWILKKKNYFTYQYFF